MLTDYFLPHIGGGVERVVYELSTRLIARGHAVMVVTLNTAHAPDHERLDGIEIVRAPAIQLSRLTGMQVSVAPIAPITALRAIRRFKPDVLHAHSSFFFLSAIAPLLKAIDRVPLVTTLHVAEMAHLSGWPRRATSVYEATVARVLVARSDEVTVVSEAVRAHALETLHADARKITLIPNGVDAVRFRPHEGRRVGGAGKNVVSVGRLIFNKGPQFLLEAAPAILMRHPDARFVFAGDGPMRDELEAAARRLHIDRMVEFIGTTDDVPRILGEADILVRPSLSEGMPLTVLEAMACGLPVVASTVGGNGEAVQDGVTGYLVPPADTRALADRISELLDDPALCRRMGEAGRAIVEAAHSWDQVAEQSLAVYERALHR